MKKIVKATVALSLIAFASTAAANPKCSHRLASSSNDLLRNTNPKIVAKADTKAGQQSTRAGIK